MRNPRAVGGVGSRRSPTQLRDLAVGASAYAHASAAPALLKQPPTPPPPRPFWLLESAIHTELDPAHPSQASRLVPQNCDPGKL